jgi:AraC family transcriptional regulator
MHSIIPNILQSNEKKLVGVYQTMSLANHSVAELWKRFMPVKKEIPNQVSSNLLSVSIYLELYFHQFSPFQEFEKWAAVEVSDFVNIPNQTKTMILPSGLYAVFDYKGLNTDTRIFQYIHSEWLPDSDFELDNRPHFEILGERYKNNDPKSEEEIWIPIKPKSVKG